MTDNPTTDPKVTVEVRPAEAQDCPYCGKPMQATPEQYYCEPCRYMAMRVFIGGGE